MSSDTFELMDVGGIFFTIDGYRVRLRGILPNSMLKKCGIRRRAHGRLRRRRRRISCRYVYRA